MKRAIEPLSRQEVAALVAAAPTRSNSGLRMRALIGLLYGAGLRIQEALDLMPRDLDLAAGQVRVRHGKGDVARVVGIDAFSASLVQAWMARRSTLGLGPRHPVLAVYSTGVKGHAWDQRAARRALARVAEKADVEKRVHPHGLRHSHATDAVLNGVPVNLLQAQLGHSNLSTTDRYVRHIAAPLVVSTFSSRDPWAQPNPVASASRPASH